MGRVYGIGGLIAFEGKSDVIKLNQNQNKMKCFNTYVRLVFELIRRNLITNVAPAVSLRVLSINDAFELNTNRKY
jgi:hypothetical protein